MNYTTGIAEPVDSRVKESQPAVSFTAKLSSSRGTRIYRVYPQRDDLFFILLADGFSANPETLTVHFGLIGALIGVAMKKRAKKKHAAAIQRMDQTDPQQLLTEHKHNFKLHTSEIREGSLEPRPVITFDGHQVGHWKLQLRDDRKMKFLFENNGDMTAALNALSPFFNGSLNVNVEWDEKKKRFKKKKA